MVSLAVAYTNESFEKASYVMLLKWLKAKFPWHVPGSVESSAEVSSWALKERATEGYLNVARDQHANGGGGSGCADWVGGVVVYQWDFDRAKDCFASALEMRPNVSCLLSALLLSCWWFISLV